MSILNLLSRVKLQQQDAEIIFDRNEPVGRPTDLVMPRKGRRFLRRRKTNDAGTVRPGAKA